MTVETKIHALNNDLWEMTRTGLETMMWGQDQAETLIRSSLDQAHAIRHEGFKALVNVLDQAKVNQEDFNRKAEENFRSAIQMVPGMGTFANR